MEKNYEPTPSHAQMLITLDNKRLTDGEKRRVGEQ